MDVLFITIAVVVPLCLAIAVHRRMGCIAAIITFVAAVWGFSFLEGPVNLVNKWRNDHLAEKAKQAEHQKAQEAENARIAEAKRQQEARVTAEKRRQAEAVAEAKRKQAEKDDKIRTFALKEAPKVWSVYQSLQSEIDLQNDKIEELRKTLEAFNKSPEQDADFIRICALRDDMIRSRKVLRAKLEDAYIAAKKYEASPSREDYQELHKKALEDGILEADAASAKFKEMRLNK